MTINQGRETIADPYWEQQLDRLGGALGLPMSIGAPPRTSGPLAYESIGFLDIVSYISLKIWLNALSTLVASSADVSMKERPSRRHSACTHQVRVIALNTPHRPRWPARWASL